ncbi:amino acid adenylation domain-containing protein [Myxococcus fulvus]|uniref:non-ribosomal peptide synthetase n=1 Tax=Myxococcus fulvus TaxID=33 RepID=UPI0020C10B4F|nr:amino acid adenylation domain-containing protein [Myxococcus fulvus]MCK8500268.1 amino acid adenylation domain-containing protein [Myxococcus fulvus]
MNATELIAELTRLGVELKVEGEHLRVRAARNVITPELQQHIAARKAEVLELLRRQGEALRSEQEHAPFPLTEIQEAYLVGRGTDFGVGGISCHLYHELDGQALDVERLSRAWRRLIERHAMLRAVVLPSGEQRVLEQVPSFSMPVLDLRGQARDVVEAKLAGIRQELSNRSVPLGQWPTFELRATLLDGNRTRIHLDIDAITMDAAAVLALLEEWRELYAAPEKVLEPVPVSFREHVLAELSARDTTAYRSAEAYWRARLDDLPEAPVLPLATPPEQLVRPAFRRLGGSLDARRWERLKERSAQAGLTRSGVVCAAFAEVLAAWSESARFCLNLTLFRRLPIHPAIDQVVGDFTTNVLLEVDGRGTSFTQRAVQLREQLARDLEHLLFSGMRVMRERARRREGAAGALMPIVFTSLLGHRPGGAGAGSPFGWLGETVHGITQTPQVWLDHQVREEDGALRYSWDSPEGLFPAGMLEDAFAAYESLLGRLAEEDAVWEARSPVRLPAAQAARREAFNATASPIPEARLEALFLAQARRAPSHAAVVSAERTLSYAELRGHAGALATRLAELDARPDGLVAVILEKGWRQVVAVTAIPLAGAAYLPIDPALPDERRRLLLQEGKVQVVVTEPGLAERFAWPEGVRVVSIPDSATGEPPHAPARSPADLAYCIYTSGSTGRPKGVMVEHRAAANTLQDINTRFGVGPEDRVFGLSSLGFDLSVYDIFGSLAAGATLVLPEPDATWEPASWLRWLREARVTVWNSVPTLMEMLVDLVETRGERLPESLRLVLMSGDWIPVTLPDRIRRLSRDIQVISLGGATEGAVWSILHPITQVEPGARSIPYGRPMLNQRFHVLDEALAPRPEHVPGDLFIGGAGLARGYFGDEELSRARFFTHPDTGERLYRTGDLGRFLPGGYIEFLGRKDFQVKVAGHRIELGEIEAALCRHPALREAVVAAPGERTQRKLVGYVVPMEGQPAPTDDALREFLGRTLPHYMVPGVFMRLRALPQSANGKVDRKALPTPVEEPVHGALPLEARGGEVFTRITRLVAEVLKRPSVEPEASLLQLGATSVELIKLATMLEQAFGSRPRMSEFLTLRNTADIVAYYTRHPPAEAPPASAKVEEGLLLDPEQREAWKRARHGVRTFDAGTPVVPMAGLSEGEARRRHLERSSHRTFSSEPVEAQALGRLLSCLRSLEVGGRFKYQYGSAGSAYGVQLYLHVSAGRVRGLEAGAYYHEPARHALVRLSAVDALDASLHAPTNRSMFASSAFSLFLVCDRRAIAPLYGEKWRDFALLEAGLISQLLELRAAEQQLGLCQVGELRFDDLRAAFRLEEPHVYLHSLVGGAIAWEEGAL